MHIALCDDHAVVADGIALLLKSLDAGLRVSVYPSAAAVLAAAPAWTDVDLVLLDLGLPDSQGEDVLTRLRQLRDDVPVVVLSGVSDRATVLRCIDGGAMGFIPKSASTQAMLAALQAVLNGRVHVPDFGLPAMPERAVSLPPQLTPRQWEVLQAVLQGKPIKRIALDMDISTNTVKSHVSVILRELDVTTRTEAIVKAAQLGLSVRGALH